MFENSRFHLRDIMIRFMAVLCLIVYAMGITVSALSAEQKKLYQSGINYFDIADCGSDTSSNESSLSLNGDLKGLAQQMLDKGNITYWTNAPENPDPNWAQRVPAGGNKTAIDTKDVVRAMAQGDRAYTTAGNAPNKYADLNPNILKFILEASEKGAVGVNALTDKTHSNGSNHYKGLAVDLDLNTAVPVGELNTIAAKYGGIKNSESDHHHYDFTTATGTNSSSSKDSSEAGVTTSSIKSVYMRGDSVTLGGLDTGDIKGKFKDANISATVTGSGGGTVKMGGPAQVSPNGDQLSGLDAIQKDKDKIKSVDAIVVGYGINNYPSQMADEIKAMIHKIRSINKDAVIFWVNNDTNSNSGLTLNGTKAYTAASSKAKSKTIQDLSEKYDYNVIDVRSANLPLADGIHPTYDAKGFGKWAQLVVDGVKEGGNATEGTGTQCQCGDSSGISLVGSDNAEKIFNYFVSAGLKPYQAAAIMGNMNSESGLNPRAVEPGTTGDYPIEGRGFGLIQWTFADRQDPLIAKAKKAGVKPSDLKLQLDYVMWELENKYQSTYTKFKNSGSVEEATLIIELEFEVHAGGVQPQRTQDAKDYLAKYGSGVSDAGSGSGGTSCSTDASGQIVGEFSLPVDKKIYSAHPDWFSGPHHDYPAVDIPIPSGTKVYSMTAGTVVAAPAGGGCGNGVIINSSGGVQYTYCHGSDGGTISGAKTGDKVKPGQLIMHSDNTGTSTGPHLHIEVEINSTPHCPQKLIKSIADGKPMDPRKLPTSGCTS